MSEAQPITNVLQLIELLVCEEHHITTAHMRSPRREKKLVDARRDYAKIARFLGFSYPKIAKQINRDHTSIIHLVRGKAAE